MRWKCWQKSNFWFRFLASLNKSTMTASSDIKCGFLSWLSAPFATAWESANKSVRCQHTHLLYPPNLVTEIQIIWAPSQPWKLYQDNRQWESQSLQSVAEDQLTVDLRDALWKLSQPWMLYQDKTQWESQSLQSAADHQLTAVSMWCPMKAVNHECCIRTKHNAHDKVCSQSRASTHCEYLS